MSTATLTPGVAELLRHVRVTGPQRAGGLQVFGLGHDLPPATDYQTLDEALAAQAFAVTEASEGGSVPTLKVSNKSARRVFLMAGEQLVGAKQNRVLNTSLLIESGTELPVPVTCVEQGRWSYRSRTFGSSGSSSHSRLRAKMTRQC